MSKPKFSICMTTYNVGDVLEKSLDSIISKINPEEFEIIVVDNKSSDDTLKVFNRYAKNHENIKIISKKCLRGYGWQTAFDNSSGNIIILAAGDTIYNDLWMKAIRIYELNNFDFALSMWFSDIYPRDLIESVGGWNNLQYWEDDDLRSRCAALGRYRDYPLVCGENLKRMPSTTFTEKIYRKYRKAHDMMLLATHIPFYYWLACTWKNIRKRYRGLSAVARFAFNSVILVISKSISSIRRRLFKYGRFSSFLNYDAIAIDLGLGVTKEDFRRGTLYDTTEKCKKAYESGDCSFIPLLYD